MMETSDESLSYCSSFSTLSGPNSLNKGSLFEHTKRQLRSWFPATQPLGPTANGLSSLALRQHLDVSQSAPRVPRHKINLAIALCEAKAHHESGLGISVNDAIRIRPTNARLSRDRTLAPEIDLINRDTLAKSEENETFEKVMISISQLPHICVMNLEHQFTG